VHLKFFIAWLLTALCVVVHAIGVMALLRRGSNVVTRMGSRFWLSTWMLVRISRRRIFPCGQRNVCYSNEHLCAKLLGTTHKRIS